MSDIDDLDTSWTEELERLNKIQEIYYREPMDYIHCHFIYVNSRSEIEKVEYEKEILSEDGIIKSERLLKLIQNKKKYTNTNSKYKIKDVLLYNITLEPENIQDYSQNETYREVPNKFMKPLSLINDIIIEPSIFIFHEVNGLYFFLQEVALEMNKKVILPVKQLKSILKTQKNIDPTEKKPSTKKVRIVIDETVQDLRHTRKQRPM